MNIRLLGISMRALLCLLVVALVVVCVEQTAQPLANVEKRPSVVAPPEVRATRHVVIVVIDGPRWTETWGREGRDLIPYRAQTLAPQGVVYSDMANDGPTYTNAGHSALVTGFYQEINNSGLELPRNPTLSQRLLAAGGDLNCAWIVASKDKLQVLTDSTAPGWHHLHVGPFDCGNKGAGVGSGNRDDRTTVERAKSVISQHHPQFLLINFKEPDSAGHANKWDRFLAEILATDAYVKELWEHLQADPVMGGHTALFITNDHGRHVDGHKDGFVSHGDDCAGCRKIELVAIGPDFKRGVTVDIHRSQIDVAVTSAALLGLTIPGSSGQVMEELFAAPFVPVAPVAPLTPGAP